jgi:hypothetical protein
MTIEELRPLADIALCTAKASLEKQGFVSPVFLLRTPDGKMLEGDMPSGTEHLMFDGAMKMFGKLYPISPEAQQLLDELCPSASRSKAKRQ